MSPRKKKPKTSKKPAPTSDASISTRDRVALAADDANPAMEPIPSSKARTKARERRLSRDAAQPLGGESRASIASTVAWMTSLVTVIATMLMGAASWGIVATANIQPDQPTLLNDLPIILFAASCVAGISSIGLIPVVYRVRDTPPPRAITVGAVAIGVLPILALVAFLVAR